MFHSIRGGLEELREDYNYKYEEIHDQHKNLVETSKGLRKLAARSFVSSEDEVI